MNLQELRDLVDMEDIPHPTVPEYKEHHESIQKILVAIDGMIADEETTEELHCEANPEYTDGQREALLRGLNMLRAQIKEVPIR
jgi:hypothetical protein